MDFYEYDDEIEAGDAELIFGKTIVHCPHCEVSLKVATGNPADLIWYTCPNCRERFCIDWAK